jgi:hypothetical protein
MNFEKITRTAIMLGFFLLLFAIRPGFGKMDLERYDTKIDGEMTRLTDGKIKVFKKYSCGFELRCPPSTPVKEADLYGEEFIGLVVRAFVE